MKMFNKIVCVDDCGLSGKFKDEIFKLSSNISELNTQPTTDEEIIERIGNADCALVSWKTKINASVLQLCPKLKYIGMCCSLYDEKSANVDIAKARELGITVKGVRDYGDEGTLEFVFAQLINLFSGTGKHQYADEPTEIKGKTLGAIGMGVLGQLVAQMALNFGMNVYYYSRTRKVEVEKSGIQYAPLHKLLPLCDIISLHLPRNTNLLNKTEFSLLKQGTVIVNTSLGQAFDIDAFISWIESDKQNYAIMDSVNNTELADLYSNHKNIIFFSHSSGFTKEAKNRLTEKVWQNMVDFL